MGSKRCGSQRPDRGTHSVTGHIVLTIVCLQLQFVAQVCQTLWVPEARSWDPQTSSWKSSIRQLALVAGSLSSTSTWLCRARSGMKVTGNTSAKIIPLDLPVTSSPAQASGAVRWDSAFQVCSIASSNCCSHSLARSGICKDQGLSDEMVSGCRSWARLASPVGGRLCSSLNISNRSST